MKINRKYRIRQFGANRFLVGTGDAIQLNESGILILDAIKRGDSKEDVVTELTSIYTIEKVDAEKDYEEFVSSLISLGVISN